eukprot:GFKZ01007432.1.p2 GENE.GFKZ01007432.1~~GFKZ01007432.1.p2  ORF type:complete len:253 (+),score=58.57 GFKZ01007432.1:218-976(+)
MTKQNHNTVNRSKARDMLKELKEARSAASAAKDAKETLQMENKILKQNVEELKMKLFERDVTQGEEPFEENKDESQRDGVEGDNNSSADTKPTSFKYREEEGGEPLTSEYDYYVSSERDPTREAKKESDTGGAAGKDRHPEDLSGKMPKKQEDQSKSSWEESSEEMSENPESLVCTTPLGIATPLVDARNAEEKGTAQHCGIDTKKDYGQSRKGANSNRRHDGKIVAFGSGFAAGITISLLRALATGLRRRN